MITMVTCYDYSFAKALDGLADYFLVGDSVAMVLYGEEDTKSVGMETMLAHTKAVCKGAKVTRVIADMPIHSYDSPDLAVENALKFTSAGAYAVKLEGASPSALNSVAAITAKGIPAMGHVGLTPQWIEEYRVQGKKREQAERIIDDSLALQNAGCFSIVLECVPEALGQKITSLLKIPTVGIGAGRFCKGQVLVLYDLLGLYTDLSPKFVKKYASLAGYAREAVKKYADEVKQGKFPSEEHVFKDQPKGGHPP